METGTPDLEVARPFAEAVKAEYPDQMLAYNCSPSFNWKRHLDDATIAKFQRELGAMGYKFQFITLAGFHALNHSMFELAKGYADRRHDRLRRRCRRREFAAEADGYTATKHQREVGTGYFDLVSTALNPESDTTALRGSTEDGAVRMSGRRDHRHRSADGRYDEILTPEALDFLVALDREFAARRVAAAGPPAAPAGPVRRRRASSTSCPRPRRIRADPTWRVAPPAPGLVDRRVEITGPPDRKMTVNALNSGAKVWLADFEDATSPTWDNVIGGQLNLRDALDGRLDFTAGGRQAVRASAATRPPIVVRPRGWHLAEKHLRRRRPADARPRWSTSACTCSTAPSGSSTAAAGRTSTCPSWRATSRPGCGTTCSSSPRTCSASRAARSGPPC